MYLKSFVGDERAYVESVRWWLNTCRKQTQKGRCEHLPLMQNSDSLAPRTQNGNICDACNWLDFLTKIFGLYRLCLWIAWTSAHSHTMNNILTLFGTSVSVLSLSLSPARFSSLSISSSR